MRPKKRERCEQEGTKSHEEIMRSDHEMFLQAFEKPTQIYRYLRTRHLVAPLFLHRTLGYMGGRNSRANNKSRQKFKLNAILEKAETKLQECPVSKYRQEYMNLSFTEYTEKGRITESAQVEVFLVKLCHKRRKGTDSQDIKVSIGCATISSNSDAQDESKTVIIKSEHFARTNGHRVESYVLQFKVTSTSRPPGEEVICNGDITEDNNECDSRSKRRRTRGTSPDPRHKKCFTPSTATYEAELVIYDRYMRCLLPDGLYSLAMKEYSAESRHATWESVADQKNEGPFDVYNSTPQLKLYLSWSCPSTAACESSSTIVHSVQESSPKEHVPIHIHPNRKSSVCDTSRIATTSSPQAQVKRQRVFYQFLYNSNTRQQTEARNDLRCPWCSLHCHKLYSLLKHLRCCHPRFTFTCLDQDCGTTIDVTVNDTYDGSYVGNPHDLHSCIGFAFSRTGPVRRTPVTQLIVYRPKKPSYDLNEFLEPEMLDSHGRPFVQGHNRLYYHTLTCQPVRPQEIDDDSEAENDPAWLRQKTTNLIEEFTDVNEGEKEIMKMWNLHVMHYNYIGDCSLPSACRTFVQEYGKRIIERKLFRNFVLHLTNLYDFSLIRAETFLRTVVALQKLQDSCETGHLGSSSSPFVSLAMKGVSYDSDCDSAEISIKLEDQ